MSSADSTPEWSERSIDSPSCINSHSEPSDSELVAVVTRMAREISLKDRVYLWKEYKCCFKGTDAVQWIMNQGIAQTETEAVRFGNLIRERGFIRHVANARTFSNKDYYYWFHDSILEKSRCASSSSLYGSLMGWRGSAEAQDYDVGSELSQLQRTVHSVRSDVESGLLNAHRHVQELSHRMHELENRIMNEMQNQQRHFAALVILMGIIILLADFRSLNIIMNTFAIALITYGCLSLKKHMPKRKAIEVWGGSDCTSFHSQTLEYSEEMSSPEENDVGGVALEDFLKWPDAPCLLYAPPCLMHAQPRRLRMNIDVPFTFETELFKGEAQMWMSGLESTPSDLFKGKKRKSCFVVRGRFKERLALSDVLTGQQFSHGLKDIPAEFLLNALLKLAKSINPSYRHQLTPFPEFLSNLSATAQVINVSKPGEELSIHEPVEDMGLLDSQFQDGLGAPVDASVRKRLVHQNHVRSSLYYDTDHVWTFYFWQHLLDLSTFQLNTPIRPINLLHHLNHQPLLLMARHADGRSLWNFEIWHQSLL